VVNIVNPDLAPATPTDPLADPGIGAGPEHATFLVEPGGARQVTLRVWGVNLATNPDFARRLAVKVYSQAKNTDQTTPSDETPNDVEGNPDVVRPVFSSAGSLQGPFEVNAPGGWTVQYTKPTATDCATAGCTTPVALPASQVNCTPPSGQGAVLGVGSQAIVCTATDLGGNTATAEFSFEVRDTTPPTLTVPANIVTSTSGTTATVNYQVTATDNMSAAVSCTSSSPGVISSDLTKGGDFPVGTSTVACTATDPAGTVVAKSFTVTVNGLIRYTGLDGVYANGIKSINSSVPLDFGFTGSNGSRVDSALAQPLVKVFSSGKTCKAGILGTLIASFPGSSDYRYSASSLNWQFNWKTTGLATGCYNVTVTSVQTGQTFISRNSVTLTK
jgi:hypothetical protein